MKSVRVSQCSNREVEVSHVIDALDSAASAAGDVLLGRWRWNRRSRSAGGLLLLLGPSSLLGSSPIFPFFAALLSRPVASTSATATTAAATVIFDPTPDLTIPQDPEYGHVHNLVLPGDLSAKPPPVRQCHRHPRGPLDDVGVRHDQPFLPVKDEARSLTLLDVLPPVRLARHEPPRPEPGGEGLLAPTSVTVSSSSSSSFPLPIFTVLAAIHAGPDPYRPLDLRLGVDPDRRGANPTDGGGDGPHRRGAGIAVRVRDEGSVVLVRGPGRRRRGRLLRHGRRFALRLLLVRRCSLFRGRCRRLLFLLVVGGRRRRRHPLVPRFRLDPGFGLGAHPPPLPGRISPHRRRLPLRVATPCQQLLLRGFRRLGYRRHAPRPVFLHRADSEPPYPLLILRRGKLQPLNITELVLVKAEEGRRDEDQDGQTEELDPLGEGPAGPLEELSSPPPPPLRLLLRLVVDYCNIFLVALADGGPCRRQRRLIAARFRPPVLGPAEEA
mmetsp:Transcript_19064/g.55375  ORF Transcript_19064/g.55375 Transcript_19064/m.55375 type:complete len:496 (-) Transcript_19064:1129-2616(-)